MHAGQLMTGTLEHLRRPLVANITIGMRVLIVTDTAHDARVWQAIMSIVSELGAEPTLALFDPRPADHYDPLEAVCKAMQAVDLNILLASTGMLHSMANSQAMDAGVPDVCMDGGMTLEMFQSGRRPKTRRKWPGASIIMSRPTFFRARPSRAG